MRIAGLALVALLAGCAAQAASAPPSFDLNALVRAHPMYGTLAQYDRQIAELRSTLHAPEFAQKDQAFANAANGVRGTLNDAATRAKAIAAMPTPDVRSLQSAANLSAPSETQVRSDMQQNYQAQSSQLHAAARQSMAQYRASLLAQQKTEFANYVRSMHMRVQQAYNSRAQQLYEKESTLAVDLAKADEPKRLPIETKLRTLRLDSAARGRLQAQLNAIQSKENAKVAQQHRKDQAILAAFLPPLQARAGADIARMRADLQNRAAANLAARQRVLAAQTSGNMHLDLGSPASASTQPADVNAQLDNLARKQPADPNAFIAARDDLGRHFNAVRTADEDATRSTWAQIGTLQDERDQLYRDIVSQIAREARRIAAQRHISGRQLTIAVLNDLNDLKK